MPGPVTAVTIAKAKENRFTGAFIALGHGVIEFPVIGLVALGLLKIVESKRFQIVIGGIGGILLLLMAWEMFQMEIEEEMGKEAQIKTEILSHHPLIAGILTTTANPYFFLWWVTAGAALIMKALPFGFFLFIIFALVHWSTDFFWLLFVSYSVHETQQFLSQGFYKFIFWACSLLLVIFGVWFLLGAGEM
ncbi:MAG: LysE family transporter, partial [Promethearchaeota archaeon]